MKGAVLNYKEVTVAKPTPSVRVPWLEVSSLSHNLKIWSWCLHPHPIVAKDAMLIYIYCRV
jgi:hypothetical protein